MKINTVISGEYEGKNAYSAITNLDIEILIIGDTTYLKYWETKEGHKYLRLIEMDI